jgi:ribosome biogenesis GTPase / thiamine phosphate phosphatase
MEDETLLQNNLKKYGLSDRFIQEATLYAELKIGRICSQSRNIYKTITEVGEIFAEVSGKFRYESRYLSDYPAVGDFVMLDRTNNEQGNAIIHHVLTRKSVIERKSAGTKDEIQIIASNIDKIFICMSLNNDFNLRRLERYLSIAWNSRAIPIIVLTKSDLCKNLNEKVTEVSNIAFGVDILLTSSLRDSGINKLKEYVQAQETVAFIGSSGVGKSTLINKLAEKELLATNNIRKDGKGRHTTTRREMFLLPDGGIVIDTPGMRELGIENANLSKTFTDIDELAQHCKFRNCTHQSEPGCAVQAAIKQGILSKKRLENYQKLKKETKYEGLNSKQIEKEKIDTMFAGFGGMKQARNFIKEKNNRKN